MKKTLIVIMSLLVIPVHADEFLDSLKARLDAEPDNAYNYYALGLYYQKAGEPSSAVRYLSTAYQMSPGSESILYDLSDAYIQSGKYRQALKYLRIYLKKHPESMNTLTRIAASEIQSGNIERGKKITANLKIKGAPPVTLEYLNLLMGNYYFSKKKYFSAERVLKEVVKSSDRYIAGLGYSTLGSMQSVQGRFKQAVTSLDRAIDLDPENASPYYALAYLLETQGQFKKAAETWHLASVYTSNPDKKNFCVNRMKKLLERTNKISPRTQPGR